jgi:hypothetical protein
MSGFNNLREMNLDPNTQVKLSYSDGIDVVHCHGTHVEEAVEQTDVVERVAEVITTPGLKIEGEYGGNPLESLRDDYLLEEYPRDNSGFAEFVAGVLKENFYDCEFIEEETKQYDYKRGFTTLTANFKTTVGELLDNNTSHFTFSGWEASVKTPAGNLSFTVSSL